jgi:hypothetical protein
MSNRNILKLRLRGATVTPTPPSALPSIRPYLSSTALTHIASMDAVRANAWPGYQGQAIAPGDVMEATDSASFLSALNTARLNKAANRWFKVILKGTALDGAAINWNNNWDFGGGIGGGVLVEGENMTTECRIKLGITQACGLHIRNVKWPGNANPNFDGNGPWTIKIDYRSDNAAIDATTAARVIFEGCQFGLLWMSGKGPTDWQNFPAPIYVEWGHTAIVRGCSFYGVGGGAELRGCYYHEVSKNLIRQFFNTTFPLGVAYNESTAPYGVLPSDEITYWGYDNVWTDAWDRSDLYYPIYSDVPHTDSFQSKGTDCIGWNGRYLSPPGTNSITSTTTINDGQHLMATNGRLYKKIGTAARGSTEPTHTSGTVNGWQHIGLRSRPFNVIIEQSSGIIAPMVPPSYSVMLQRNMLMLFMDSARDNGVSYGGRVVVVGCAFAGNGNYGISSQGMDLIAEHNTQTCPPDAPVNTNGLPGALGQPYFAPFGNCESFSSSTTLRNNVGFATIGQTPGFTGTLTNDGNVLVDYTAAAGGSNSPDTVFASGFTKRGGDGCWFSSGALSGAYGALSSDAIRALVRSVLTLKPAVGTKGAVLP